MAAAPHSALGVTLVRGVGITLVEHDNGWTFGSWARADGIVLLPPSQQDRQRRFPTSEAAVAFFRDRHTVTPRAPRLSAKARDTKAP
jgi:hypothetical protein